MILQRVSPVTHSIGNSVKRVVVIASSILVFRNPVGAAGQCAALWVGGSSKFSPVGGWQGCAALLCGPHCWLACRG